MASHRRRTEQPPAVPSRTGPLVPPPLHRTVPVASSSQNLPLTLPVGPSDSITDKEMELLKESFTAFKDKSRGVPVKSNNMNPFDMPFRPAAQNNLPAVAQARPFLSAPPSRPETVVPPQAGAPPPRNRPVLVAPSQVRRRRPAPYIIPGVASTSHNLPLRRPLALPALRPAAPAAAQSSSSLRKPKKWDLILLTHKNKETRLYAVKFADKDRLYVSPVATDRGSNNKDPKKTRFVDRKKDRGHFVQ